MQTSILDSLYLLLLLVTHSGDNAEKLWAHWFLTKPKKIAAGGLVGAVSHQGFHGDALVKAWVQSS